MGVRDMVRAASRPPPSEGNHQESSGDRRVHFGGLIPRSRQARATAAARSVSHRGSPAGRGRRRKS